MSDVQNVKLLVVHEGVTAAKAIVIVLAATFSSLTFGPTGRNSQRTLVSLGLTYLQKLVLVFYLYLELLIGKVEHLHNLLLAIESVNECALLRHLQEFDEQVLFLYAAITDTKLHKEVLQTYL